MSNCRDNQSIYEIFRACRLCGSGGGYKMPIIQNIVNFDNSDTELRHKIRECVQIEVKEDDKMPPLICELCIDKVNDFFEFLEMCRQTNKATRLRLGLPPQTMPVGVPDADDCILGVTEPVYLTSEPNVPINRPGPKCVKNDRNQKAVSKETRKDTKAKQEDAKGKKEDSKGRKEDTRGRQEDTRGRKEDTRGAQGETRGRKEDTRGAQGDTRVRKEDTRGGQEDTRRTQEDTRGRKEDTRGRKEDTKSRKEEAKGKKVDSKQLVGRRVRNEVNDLLEQTAKHNKQPEAIRTTRGGTIIESRSSSCSSRSSRTRVPSPPPVRETRRSANENMPLGRIRDQQKKIESRKPTPPKPILKKEKAIKKETESDEEPLAPLPKRKLKDDIKVEVPAKKVKLSVSERTLSPPRSRPGPKSAPSCNICSHRFMSEQAVATHKRSHRPTFTPVELACNACREWFSTDVEAAAHHDRHTTWKQMYRCRRCQGRYKTQEAFEKHIEDAKCTPWPVVPDVECSSCGKTFITDTLRLRHKCSGLTGVKCSKCNRSYASSTSLKKHERLCTVRNKEVKKEPKIRQRLPPTQVRVVRCDSLLKKRKTGRYDVSALSLKFGLDRSCVYPYLTSYNQVIVKREPLACDSMVVIKQEIKDEFYKEEDYVHWDSDLSSDSDDDLDTTDVIDGVKVKKVDSLTTLSLKTIFSKQCLGKVPRKLRKVKQDNVFESLFNANDADNDMSDNINSIIDNLGDEEEKVKDNDSGTFVFDNHSGNVTFNDNGSLNSDSLLQDEDKSILGNTNANFDTFIENNEITSNNDLSSDRNNDKKVDEDVRNDAKVDTDVDNDNEHKNKEVDENVINDAKIDTVASNDSEHKDSETVDDKDISTNGKIDINDTINGDLNINSTNNYDSGVNDKDTNTNNVDSKLNDANSKVNRVDLEPNDDDNKTVSEDGRISQISDRIDFENLSRSGDDANLENDGTNVRNSEETHNENDTTLENDTDIGNGKETQNGDDKIEENERNDEISEKVNGKSENFIPTDLEVDDRRLLEELDAQIIANEPKNIEMHEKISLEDLVNKDDVKSLTLDNISDEEFNFDV